MNMLGPSFGVRDECEPRRTGDQRDLEQDSHSQRMGERARLPCARRQTDRETPDADPYSGRNAEESPPDQRQKEGRRVESTRPEKVRNAWA